MGFLADLLLAAAAFGAALYCFVLSRRLKALSSLDSGMGGAIALLSAQVDDLTRALTAAQERAGTSREHLDAQAARAEAACQRLELLLSSMHDLPDAEPGKQGVVDAAAPPPTPSGPPRIDNPSTPAETGPPATPDQDASRQMAAPERTQDRPTPRPAPGRARIVRRRREKEEA